MKMRLTKLLGDSTLVEHDEEYIVILTSPLRAVKITDKQFRIIQGVKALFQDLIDNDRK